jgi:hypothetical protein
VFKIIDNRWVMVCPKCSKMTKPSNELNKAEKNAIQGGKSVPPYYCEKHKLKHK